MPNPKPYWNPVVARVPVVLTFLGEPDATACECQSREARGRLLALAGAPRHVRRHLAQSTIDSGVPTSQVKHRFSKDSQDSTRGQIRSRNQTYLPDDG